MPRKKEEIVPRLRPGDDGAMACTGKGCDNKYTCIWYWWFVRTFQVGKNVPTFDEPPVIKGKCTHYDRGGANDK